MKAKPLLVAYAITALVICVNFLAVPQFWIRLYGAEADPQAVFLYRLLGALFGGMAMVAWGNRSICDRPTLRGLVVANAMLSAVALIGALTHVYNAFAWGPTVMFAFFAASFSMSSVETPVIAARTA